MRACGAELLSHKFVDRVQAIPESSLCQLQIDWSPRLPGHSSFIQPADGFSDTRQNTKSADMI
jgi:hypothetical protein